MMQAGQVQRRSEELNAGDASGDEAEGKGRTDRVGQRPAHTSSLTPQA